MTGINKVRKSDWYEQSLSVYDQAINKVNNKKV